MRTTLAKKGFREVRSHWIQYLMLMLVLGLGLGTYNSFADLDASRTQAFEVMIGDANYFDLKVSFEHGMTADRADIMEILVNVSAMGGVTATETRLAYDVFLNITDAAGEDRTTKGRIISYEAFTATGADRLPAVNTPLFYDGRQPTISAPGAAEVLIENAYARAHGIEAGDRLTILTGSNTTVVTVVDRVNIPEFFMVFDGNSPLPADRTYGVLLVAPELARAISSDPLVRNRTEAVNEILFDLDEGVDAATLGQDLEAAFDRAGIPVAAVLRADSPAYNFMLQDIEGDRDSMGIFPLIIFMVAGFGLLMILRRMIRNHRPQIGIFLALGVKRSVIIGYFAIVGLIVFLGSLVMGAIITALLDWASATMMARLIGWARWEWVFDPAAYAISFSVALALCLGVTVIPAYFATRINPIDAIQAREGLKRGAAAKLAESVGRLRFLPVAMRMAVRNILRSPGRSLTSILGVAMSLALFLGITMLMVSIVDSIEANAEVNEWDMEVRMAGFVPAATSDPWVPLGVEQMESGLLLPTLFQADDAEMGGMLYALDDPGGAYVIDLSTGSLTGGGLVISEYLAKELDLAMGDQVTFAVPRQVGPDRFQSENLTLPVSGIHTNHLGITVFADLSAVQEAANLTGMVNLYYIHTAADADPDLEYHLVTTPGVAGVDRVEDRAGLLDDFLGVMIGMIVIFALISMALAGAIVYNLARIQADERRRDYATMKTLGTTLRRIGMLIGLEMSITTFLGIILGCLGGWVFVLWFLSDRGEQLAALNIDASFDWVTAGGGSLLIILVVVFVGLLNLRWIAKIQIADVIRDRSS